MKTWKRNTALAAAALIAGTSLAACGDAPEESSAKKSDFLPCMVSDSGGFDDHSFNQLGFEGLKQAADELGSEMKTAESKDENDYQGNIEAMITAGCDVIVTVGFNLSAATVTAAKANPDIPFVLIDDAADNDFDGKKDADNIKPLLYNTAQAAFLAGYAAADYSKTGKVGTYGGQPFPTVTVFMDGFKQGVEYYNQQKKKSVKVIGFEGQDKGTFTGGFAANPKATNTAKQIIGQGVDVIMPVGGPIYQGALTAMQDTGKNVALIGVDADFFETDPNTKDVIFTSVLKGMKVSTYEAVKAVADESNTNDAYVGTLENNGVGIAPFHNFESKVNPSLQGELDAIKAGIIGGSIKVTSYLDK